MADRVRMKSKSTFDNPMIHNHASAREGKTTVIDGDEFSTEPEHAEQLEQAKLAEKVSGDVSERTERQEKLKGAQVSAGNAIAGNRKATQEQPLTGGAPAGASAPAAGAGGSVVKPAA